MIPASSSKRNLSRGFWLVILPIVAILTAASVVTSYFFPQYNKLIILLLYSIPSQFIVAVIPHEPIIFYYSKYFSPLMVTLVTLLGTLFAEYLNYMLVKLFFTIPKVDELRKYKTFKYATHYFLRLPFISLVVAAITPVPFYPFRIIAPASEYPLSKYLLALVVGRSPRFYILAYFGYMVPLPNEIIIVVFIVLLALSLAYLVKRKGFR